MPIIKSAKKRVKVAASANLRNARTKRAMREAIKAYSKVLAAGKPKEIMDARNKAVSAVDTAVKKNVLHKNKAARIKARLSDQAKSAGAKPTKPATVKKPAAAKKKAPAKAKTTSAKS